MALKAKNKILNLPKFQSLMKTLLNKYMLLITMICTLGSANLIAQNEGAIQIQSSDNIKSIIAKKRAYNKNVTQIKGYKIQLFYGNEEGAYKVRDEFSIAFPDTTIQIRFFSPEWKVWVGSYKTQLAADRALKEIKAASFNAFVFATEIKI